jgi:hypothetical protein
VGADAANVVVQSGGREVSPQHGLCFLIDFDSPRGREPFALKAEVEAADPAEQ